METPAATPVPTGYCLRCQLPKELQNPVLVTLANGRLTLTGNCPICFTKISKLVKRPALTA